ncbi:MAG: DUF456 family protein [Phycisphaerales bacterium]|nr:DUF456 family protein [Phycisphaerales bacterium]
MTILAGSILALATVLGTLLTLITLPGLWFILLVALGLQWWQPGTFSWWTLGAGLVLGLLGEVIELAASGAGAKRAGGGRAGAWSAVIGALAGAIAGTFVVPIIGSIVGGVLGAGLGAAAGERAIAGRSWSHSVRVGRGAAVGRFVAVVVKTLLTLATGIALCVAAFLP